MRGRKPKPSHLRILDGYASHSAKPNPDEPIPTGDLLEAAPELSALAQKIWREAISSAPPGMLKLLDRSAFQGWCVAFATFQEADGKVQGLGLLVMSKEGNAYQNPYLAIRNKAAVMMRQFASDLGFNPTARTRVKVVKSASTSNPFGNLKSLND